jgi:hypothetical protein
MSGSGNGATALFKIQCKRDVVITCITCEPNCKLRSVGSTNDALWLVVSIGLPNNLVRRARKRRDGPLRALLERVWLRALNVALSHISVTREDEKIRVVGMRASACARTYYNVR